MKTFIINFKTKEFNKDNLPIFIKCLIECKEYKNGILIDPYPEELSEFINKCKKINYDIYKNWKYNSVIPELHCSLLILDLEKYDYSIKEINFLFYYFRSFQINIVIVNSELFSYNYKVVIQNSELFKNNLQIYGCMSELEKFFRTF